VNRAEKNTQIAEIAETLGAAAGVYLVNLQGLSAVQVTDLRRRIKGAKGSCRVVKNRLAIRGARGTSAEKLASHFRGPIGVVVHKEEPVTLAKVLSDFAKDHPAFSMRAAIVEGQPVDVDGIKRLASLPGMHEMRAMFLGLLLSPASRLVRVLAAPGTQAARVLSERGRKLGEG
jgi:large subunit ribosomal protein L10